VGVREWSEWYLVTSSGDSAANLATAPSPPPLLAATRDTPIETIPDNSGRSSRIVPMEVHGGYNGGKWR